MHDLRVRFGVKKKRERLLHTCNQGKKGAVGWDSGVGEAIGVGHGPGERKKQHGYLVQEGRAAQVPEGRRASRPQLWTQSCELSGK